MELEFFYHARNRLFERYNMTITQEEYEKLCADLFRMKVIIRNSKPAGGGRSEFTITFKDQAVRLIWDKKTRQIVTILPPEA